MGENTYLWIEDYLDLTIQEAKKSFDSGNFPVGAVLIDDNGKLIDSAHNLMHSKQSRVLHAEMNLIIKNQLILYENPDKYTLYSSLEPCLMCMGTAIINKIFRFVWAINDSWAGASNIYSMKSPYFSCYEINIVDSPSIALMKESRKLIVEWLKLNRPDLLLKMFV